MKAVTYCIRTFNSDSKMSGRGYIDDRDLIIACVSKSGKPYVKRFDGIVEKSSPVLQNGTPNGFQGHYTEHYEQTVVLPDDDKRPNYTVEREKVWSVWFKICEE